MTARKPWKMSPGLMGATRRPVLVVGEDPDLREMIAHLLETRGHLVVDSESPDRVAEACRTHRPAVVVMELMLPSEQLTSAIEAIQAELGAACPPIVMLTGSWFEEKHRNLTDSVETVIAPGRGEELLALVERHCEPLRAR